MLKSLLCFMESDHYLTAAKIVFCSQTELSNNTSRTKKVQHFLSNSLSIDSFSCRNLHSERISSFAKQSRLADINLDFEENSTLDGHDSVIPNDDSITRNVVVFQQIIRSHENGDQLRLAIDHCMLPVNEDLVVQVLRRQCSDWKPVLYFFNWASTHNSHSHGSRDYNEMIDILGRMKQIRLMQQVFDNIPKDKSESVINNKTFSILMNKYAAAHKVQESIDAFYKRKDYGFELDLAGFQTRLMSLCRFKHVEEAELSFCSNEMSSPPVIKSRNIILNGWDVLGSLHEAKRFWNDIISSKCKPDLFTYNIFINSLMKSGKLGTAVKLFTTMWEKRCNPDVTICNTIIDQLCFKKKIPEALEIFGEMTERGCLPDVSTYNSLIKHLCKIRNMEKAYELLNEMERKNCPPNTGTYSYLLKTVKKPEEKGTQFIWEDMEKNGLGLDQRSYTIMVHGLHSEGKLDEALEYYSKMRSKGMTPEPMTRLLIKAFHLKR